MSRKRTILLLIGVAALLLVTNVLRFGRSRYEQPRKSVVTEPGPAATPNSTLLSSPSTANVGPQVPDEIAKNPIAAEYYQGVRTPVSFWGKVVDEAGHAVPGATVTLSLVDNVLGRGTTYTQQSDARGLFALTGAHGLGISVLVTKEGYYRIARSSATFGYAEGTSRDAALPSIDNPAEFVLRKKGQVEPLVVRSATIALNAQGEPSTFVLLPRTTDAEGAGRLAVQVWKNGARDPNRRFPWRFRIALQDGGLTPRLDEFSFIAPQEGYQAAEETAILDIASGWVPQLSKEYFVRFGNDRYARVKVIASSRPDPFVTITAYVNPTQGSRNLEFDPKKQVNVGKK